MNEDDNPLKVRILSLDDLAHFLDTNCDKWNVNRYNRSLVEALESADCPGDLAENVKMELVALGLWFDGCAAKREWSATTDAGEEVGSPLPNQLKPAALDYFTQRFERTNNPYLKARYGLILWNTFKPYKHIRYIQAVPDNLLTAINSAASDDQQKRQNDVVDIFSQVCAVADAISYREADVITAVLERFTKAIPFELKCRNRLFHVITDYPKLFGPKTSDILTVTRSLFEENLAEEEFSSCVDIAEAAAPFAQRSKLDVQEWHYRRGQAYEGQAQKRLSDDSSMVSIEFYSRAAQAYQLSGNEAARQNALQRVQDLKSELRLSTVEIPYPEEIQKTLNEKIKSNTEHLLSLDSDIIFHSLATEEEVVPNYVDIRKQVGEAELSISDIASVIGIDVNKNFQHAGADTTDGVPTEKLRMHYQGALDISMHFFVHLLIEGCRNGKLTFPALRNYLDTYSWVAQPLSEIDFSGKKREYTWQPMLYPALEEFFKQLHVAIQQEPSTPASFVLCLDSLTLKIEGLLRELLQRTGTATVTTNKADLREVYFDNLVEMAQQRGLLSESEAFYIRFVFTGFSNNIRNDIAHSYYHLPQNYSLPKMILVFLALLRLVGFRLTANPSAEEA